MPTDSAEQRALAAKQRDQGLLNPGDLDYDAKMASIWGGPQIKFFPDAIAEYSTQYSACKGKVVSMQCLARVDALTNRCVI